MRRLFNSSAGRSRAGFPDLTPHSRASNTRRDSQTSDGGLAWRTVASPCSAAARAGSTRRAAASWRSRRARSSCTSRAARHDLRLRRRARRGHPAQPGGGRPGHPARHRRRRLPARHDDAGPRPRRPRCTTTSWSASPAPSCSRSCSGTPRRPASAWSSASGAPPTISTPTSSSPRTASAARPASAAMPSAPRSSRAGRCTCGAARTSRSTTRCSHRSTTEHGTFVTHAYPYAPTAARSWSRPTRRPGDGPGFDADHGATGARRLATRRRLRYLEQVFADAAARATR